MNHQLAYAAPTGTWWERGDATAIRVIPHFKNDIETNVTHVAFDRENASPQRSLINTLIGVFKSSLEKAFQPNSLNTNATDINYYGSSKNDYSDFFINLLALERVSNDDLGNDLFSKIIKCVSSKDDDYKIDFKTALSGMSLASELLTVSEEITCYASPGNTLTFELIFDGTRATVIHGKENALVISKGDTMEWENADNTPEGFQTLLNKIKTFKTE